jgi:hypothetical protein
MIHYVHQQLYENLIEKNIYYDSTWNDNRTEQKDYSLRKEADRVSPADWADVLLLY